VPSRFPRLVGAEAAKVKLALGDDANTVRLFYGTDRARQLSPRGVVGYSWRRANKLSYGVCWVTIPAGNLHATGKLEGPSWFKLDFSYDPKRHVTLYEIAPLDRELWLEQVNWLGKKLNTKQLLLFVHGYNVSFQDAATKITS
jgi:esterase/lipase superfamily enzyme